MIGYASNTGTRRNLAALRAAGWGLVYTPSNCETNARVRDGFRYCCDNDAWKCYRAGIPFDDAAFAGLVERLGAGADFVVLPDIVAGGLASLEFSRGWMPRLRWLKSVLLPLQDGMTPAVVGKFLREFPKAGLFLGGSTAWKLETMYAWGAVAHAFGRLYHVGRVNSRRRIRLAAEAGAHSFDGSSASRYACSVPLLDAARRQPSLYTPSSQNALGRGAHG